MGILSINTDYENNIIIGGKTNNQNFPLENAQFDVSKGSSNAFLAKINGETFKINFSTLLTGTGQDGITNILIQGNNNIFIDGSTNSDNLPLKYEYQANQGYWDGYFAYFSPSGELLLASYLGGLGNDFIYSIAFDENKSDLVLYGHTSSSSFPLMNPYQTSYKGGDFDMFIAKFNLYCNNTISSNTISSLSTENHSSKNVTLEIISIFMAFFFLVKYRKKFS